jgi:hypothetical protein
VNGHLEKYNVDIFSPSLTESQVDQDALDEILRDKQQAFYEGETGHSLEADQELAKTCADKLSEEIKRINRTVDVLTNISQELINIDSQIGEELSIPLVARIRVLKQQHDMLVTKKTEFHTLNVNLLNYNSLLIKL